MICCTVASAPPAVSAEEKKDEEFVVKFFDLLQGRLAFSYATTDKRRHILVLDFATLNFTPFAPSGGSEDSPRWSPDHGNLLFESDRTGRTQIYVAAGDGSGLKQLTNEPAGAVDPDWSPDGKKIIYEALSGAASKDTSVREGSSPSGLVMINADGTGRTVITQSSKSNFAPRWSPKGDEILYSSAEYWPGLDLLTYSVAAKKVTILTTGYESFSHAAWSPDGSRFAFCYGSKDDTDIWIRAPKQDKGAPIVTRSARDCDPEWFDDEHLFFAGEIDQQSGMYQIFLANTASQDVFQVLESRHSLRSPAWNPYSPGSKTKAQLTPQGLPNLRESNGAPSGGKAEPAASPQVAPPVAAVPSPPPAAIPTVPPAPATGASPASSGSAPAAAASPAGGVLPPYAEGL